MRTGVECLMDGLKKAGVQTIFGLPGGSVLDIFNGLYDAPFKFVLTRHEQGATHMADGYARATGRVGCCLVTSGPGATNTVTGLGTAYMDSIPLVCISGQVPTHMIGNDAFQEADTTGITRPVTKHNYLVRDVDDLPRIIAEAFYIAGTGKPGPVLVDIPKDVQRASTKAHTPDSVSIRGYNPNTEGHPKQITRLAEAINKAKKPLLYVGGGAIAANAAEEVTQLARQAKIPVTTTLLGLGAFPETDPLALRMLGMHGSVTANYATHHCDLLVSIGARFDDRVTGKIAEFAPHAKIAHIDIDPTAISKSVPADIPVVGDVKQVLKVLIPLVESKERTEWLTQIQEWKQKNPFAYEQQGTKLMPQYVIEQIYALTKGDAIIVTEVGQHQMWSAQYYKYTQPRTFISSGGL
ncbi:MAG: biosynthetic-type acetolactate synthase large subunit, partial [Kiritimatiellae bacterium]|nr:biosynthetic-type acetolactate synthase large subunit [Kiritimatiellia bacterium]